MPLLPQDPRKRNLVLIAALPPILAAAYWQMVWSPKSDEMAKTEEHVAALEQSNQKADAALRGGKVQQIKAEAARFEDNLNLMRTLVPTGNEVPALLEQVSTAARRVGLDLSSVEPEPVIAGDQFDTYRYKMSLTGPYHPVAEFLTSVGSLTRIVAPVNLTLTASSPEAVKGKGPAPAPGQSVIDTKFEIQTYVLKAPDPNAGARRPIKGVKS